jgi:hypothetical protein
MPGDLAPAGNRAAAFIVRDQLPQGYQGLALQLFAHQERPILKTGAVAQGQAFEKIAPIERNGLLQSLVYGPVRFRRLYPCLERVYVEPVVAGKVGLDRLACDEQKGWRLTFRMSCIPTTGCRAIPDCLAQAGQRIAKIGQRDAIGSPGPQQFGQSDAQMRA